MARIIPLLPLRDIIVFPHMVVPLFVGREKSIAALEEAMAADKELLLAAQKKAKTNDPGEEDIFEVGTIGHIIQLLRLPDGTVKVLVEGRRRAKILRYEQEAPFFLAEVEDQVEEKETEGEIEPLVRSIKEIFEVYVKLNKRIPPEMLVSVQTIDEPARLADTIVAHLSLKLIDKQTILELGSAGARLKKLDELMQSEIEILQVEKKIRSRVKKQMEKSQKEYYLNEQMQAIQKELGDRDEFKNELQELEQKIKTKPMSDEARVRALKGVKKLKMMSPMSAEATVVRNYIDWILALPWSEKSEDRIDLAEAEEILDQDHYGLKKPKERVLEYLAVQALVAKFADRYCVWSARPASARPRWPSRSLEPPVASSCARALAAFETRRRFADTGAPTSARCPASSCSRLKKVGTNNPVFLLDEIDKMSSGLSRRSRIGRVLEVLDPEQNENFVDHYLDLDYDLSDVIFITTANTQHQIPLPLQDRLEIIQHSRLHGMGEARDRSSSTSCPSNSSSTGCKVRRWR